MFAPGFERHIKVVLGADTGAFKAQMAGATASLTKFKAGAAAASGGLRKLKMAFALAGAAAIALGGAIIGKAIAAAAEFNQAMARVKAVTGATGAQFDSLRKKATDLGKTTKFTMTEIAAGMESLGRAGFSTQEIISAMGGVTALASSQMMSLADAGEITANILRAMKLPATDANRVVNLLAATAASSNTTVQSLGESFKMIAPLAAQLGISVEEVAAIIGKLGDVGFRGTMATSTLATAMLRLAKPTKAARDAMDALNISFWDSKGNFIGFTNMIGLLQEKFKGLTTQQQQAYLAAIFGARAVKQINALIALGADNLATYTKSVTGTNAAFKQQAIMLDTLSGQWTILKGSLNLLMVSIGEKLTPILKNFLKNTLIPLVNKLADWASKSTFLQKAMQGFFGFLSAVLKNSIAYIKTFIQVIHAMQTDIAAGWDWLSKTIRGNTALKSAFSAMSGWMKDFSERFVEGMKQVSAFFEAHKGPIVGAILAIGAAFATWQIAAWVAALNPWILALTGLGAALAAVIAYLPEITSGWNSMVSALGKNKPLADTFKAMKEASKQAWEGIKEGVTANAPQVTQSFSGLVKAAQKLWAALSDVFHKIAALFGLGGETATSLTAFRDLFKATMGVILEIVTMNLNAITAAMNIFADLLEGNWKQAWIDFKNYIKEQWDAIVRILDIIGLTGAITKGWNALKTETLKIWTGIKTGIKSIWDSIVTWFQDALNSLISALTSWMPGWLKKWLGVGKQAALNLKEGLDQGKPAAQTAGQALAQAAADGVNATKGTMISAGQSLGSSFAAGVKSSFDSVITDIENKITATANQISGLSISGSTPSSTLTLPGLGNIPKKQQGGAITGTGSGDTVPALLTPGEFVIPKWMMQISWFKDLVVSIYKHGKRFRMGGIVDEGAVGAGAAPSTATSAGAAMADVSNSATKAASSLDLFWSVTQNIAQSIPGQAGAVISELADLAKSISETGFTIENVGNAIGMIFRLILQFLQAQIDALKKKKKELEGAISFYISAFQQAAGVMSKFAGMLGPIGGIFNATITAFGSALKMLTEHGLNLLSTGMSMLTTFVGSLIDTITGLISQSDAYQAVQEQGSRAWKAVANLFGQFLWPLAALLKELMSWLGVQEKVNQETATEIGVPTAWKRTLRAYEAAAPGRIVTTTAGATAIPAWATALVKGIASAIEGVLTKFGISSWADLLESFKEGSIAFWNYISSKIPELIASLTSIFNSISTAIGPGGLVNQIVGWLKSAYDWLVNKLPGIVQAGIDFLGLVFDLLGKVWTWLNNLDWNGIWKEIQLKFNEFMTDLGNLKKFPDAITALQDISKSIDSLKKTMQIVILTATGALIGGFTAVIAAANPLLSWAILPAGGAGLLAGGLLGAAIGALLPKFDTGGIIPGPIGSPQLIVAHGGEAIIPYGQSAQPTVYTEVHVYLGQEEVSDFVIDRIQHRSKLLTGSRSTAAGLTRRGYT